MKHPIEYQQVLEQKRKNGQLYKGRKSLSTVCSLTDDDDCHQIAIEGLVNREDFGGLSVRDIFEGIGRNDTVMEGDEDEEQTIESTSNFNG
jgi:hypothetical protein